MGNSDSDSATNDSSDALARLYDDPDEKRAELQSIRPNDSTVERQRAIFRALANEDRLRLLGALEDGEKCSCELEAVLDAPQSTVATHLRTLRDAGIVNRRRSGRWSYYRIADSGVLDVLGIAASMGES